MRIHQDTIDAVKARADIVDVIGEKVVLKKSGPSYSGLCPFHDDKSPSLSVSPSKQLFYCFGCGEAGDSIGFLMKFHQLNLAQAILPLAMQYGIEVKLADGKDQADFQRQLSKREQLYEIMAVANQFFVQQLWSSAGQAALNYLRQARGFDDDTIQEFQFGYAPAAWSQMLKALTAKGFSPELLLEAGLLVRRDGDGHTYDRFRNRIMIPIHDVTRRVIAFGGRAMGEDKPKYLNSPETPLFNKGSTLYLLDRARGAIQKEDGAIVVEGYFDAVALQVAGIGNAVATLGTAVNADQVRQLLRYTESKRIVLNFDSDTAGKQAAQRAIAASEEMARRGEVALKVLVLPEGKDPDEFLRHHDVEHYEQLLAAAPLWVEWQIAEVLAACEDLSQLDQFQKAADQITALLGGITNATLRTALINRSAHLLSQGNPHLAIDLEQDLRKRVRGRRWHGQSKKWETPTTRTLVQESEAQLLRIFVHYPHYRQSVKNAIVQSDLEFVTPLYRQIWMLLETLAPGTQNQDVTELIHALCVESDPPISLPAIEDLLVLTDKTRTDIECRTPLVVQAAIGCMEKAICDKRYHHFKELWGQVDLEADPDAFKHYQDLLMGEKRRIQQINETLRQVPFAKLFGN